MITWIPGSERTKLRHERSERERMKSHAGARKRMDKKFQSISDSSPASRTREKGEADDDDDDDPRGVVGCTTIRSEREPRAQN